MSYTVGDLRVSPFCDEQKVRDYDCWEHDHPTDSRAKANVTVPIHGVAYLPHSCNEWVIGGPAQIRLLITALESALRGLERK
jgi:hypothetical protein